MANTVLVSAESSAAALEEGHTATAVQHMAKSNFSHLSNGNYEDTRKAIEAFLVSKGKRRQGYGAELIMFMERSFSGKYRNGERSHYQRIMPDGKWREGDTLSEKLTRCKDKETFKRRFDHIGTTADLKREHFDNREITNLDFKGRMYLRLMDTNKNLSLFYRNDELVDAFIKSAIASYREELKARKYKTRRAVTGNPEVLEVGKPEVVYRENPNPLLYTEVDSRRLSGKNKGNSLRLVHSSPNGKNQDQPRERIEDKKASDLGFEDYQAAIEVGLLPDIEVSCGAIKQRTSSAKSYSGIEVFKLWYHAVMTNLPGHNLHKEPTGQEIGQSKMLYLRFIEFFACDELPAFFDQLTKNWTKARHELKAKGLFGFGEFPKIPWLLRNSDDVLTWRKDKNISAAKEAELKLDSQKRFAQQDQPRRVRPLAPYKGCEKVNAEGRTFDDTDISVEYRLANCIRFSRAASEYGFEEDNGSLDKLRMCLAKRTLNQEASDARIDELLQLPADEFEMLCC